MTRIRRIVKSERGIYEVPLREEDVLGQIRTLLELNGAQVSRIIERIPWGKTRSEGGIPDLLCVWPKGCQALLDSALGVANQFTAIATFQEIKRPGGKLRPSQETWLAQAQAIGLIAFKAESWEEVKAEFGRFGIALRGS